jgi:cell wall-associated NlpC family hydrolase
MRRWRALHGFSNGEKPQDRTRLMAWLGVLGVCGWLAAVSWSVGTASAEQASPPAVSPSGTSKPAVVTPPTADSPANALAAQVLAETQRILANLKSTTYQRRTEIDEAAGSYKCDCSGLVGYVLKRVARRQWAAVPVSPGFPRSSAMDCYEWFRGCPATLPGRSGWVRVPRLLDARPGDLIAWRVQDRQPGQSTGHVMFIAATPRAEADGSVRVVVIDSTTSPHDDDTRAAGAAGAVDAGGESGAASAAAVPGGAGTAGVGRGTMWFRVDDQGAPVAYRRSSKSDFQAAPLAIGRVMPLGDGR